MFDESAIVEGKDYKNRSPAFLGGLLINTYANQERIECEKELLRSEIPLVLLS